MILLVLDKGQRCSEVLIEVVAGAWHGFMVFWSVHVILLVLGKGQRCSEMLIGVVAGVFHGMDSWCSGVLTCDVKCA